MFVRAAVASILLTLTACGFQPRDRGQPQQVGRDRSGAALTFGNIEQVEGTRFFTISIVRVEGDGNPYGSFKGGANDERNRLIVDSASGASRRVLPNTDFEIVNWFEPTVQLTRTGAVHAIAETAGDGEATRPSGIYAAVVKRPGRTDKDPASYDLLLGRYEDGRQAWVARGLAGIEAVWLTPDQKLAVVAAGAKGGIYRLYDSAGFEQLLEKDLVL